jgi:hypothetical protein
MADVFLTLKGVALAVVLAAAHMLVAGTGIVAVAASSCVAVAAGEVADP